MFACITCFQLIQLAPVVFTVAVPVALSAFKPTPPDDQQRLARRDVFESTDWAETFDKIKGDI